jgi:hypothetical protein
MNRWIRRGAIAVGALLVLGAATLVAGTQLAER